MRKVKNYRDSQKKFKKLSEYEQFEKIAEAFSEKLSFDQELNLPFGFTFDHYLMKRKAKKLAREGSQTKKHLWKIYDKLKVKNDLELLQYYRHAVAEKSQVFFLLIHKKNFMY